jgi:hypothetical protein
MSKIRGNVVGTTQRPEAVLVRATGLTDEQKVKARENINAAPGGYGWGTTQAKYFDGDLNTVWNTGLYNVVGASNSPFHRCMVLVLTADANTTYQIAYETDNTRVVMRRGYLKDNEWYEWELLGNNTEVNLDDYVKNTDYATTEKHGVVKVGAGLSIQPSNNTLQVEYANQKAIQNKAGYRNPLAPVFIDDIVKVGITTNQILLTDEEKQAAKDWLGVVDGGGIPVPETAEVGQTIVVKAVDENGKPTEWEAADLPSGGGGGEWKLLAEGELTEAVSTIDINKDLDGKAFSVDKIRIELLSKTEAGATGYCNAYIQLNESSAYQITNGLYAGTAIDTWMEYEYEKNGMFPRWIGQSFGLCDRLHCYIGTQFNKPIVSVRFGTRGALSYGTGTKYAIYYK